MPIIDKVIKTSAKVNAVLNFVVILLPPFFCYLLFYWDFNVALVKATYVTVLAAKEEMACQAHKPAI